MDELFPGSTSVRWSDSIRESNEVGRTYSEFLGPAPGYLPHWRDQIPFSSDSERASGPTGFRIKEKSSLPSFPGTSTWCVDAGVLLHPHTDQYWTLGHLIHASREQCVFKNDGYISA